MPHAMSYNSELHIIETKYQGIITFDEIIEAFSEALKIVQAFNCFLTLGDYRNAFVKLSTLEIHQLPTVISDISAPAGVVPQKLKRAFVVNKNVDDFHFFETVTVNNGQLAKIFQDVDEAKNGYFKNNAAQQSVHLTLGILRKSQAVSYALPFFWLDGFAVPAPAQVTQSVRRLPCKSIQKGV